MNSRPSFYKVGIIGLLTTIVLHAVVSFTTSSIPTSFFIIYPSWIAFIMIGNKISSSDPGSSEMDGQ